VWRLPMKFEETCVVADAFHLKPFLPLLASDGLFYVLALSENEVRLLQGTSQSVNELVLPNVPSAMEELLATDGEGAALNFHTGAGAGTTTGRAAVFHGHGGMDKAAEKDLRLKFFRQVDKALREFFRDKCATSTCAGEPAGCGLAVRMRRCSRNASPEGSSRNRASHQAWRAAVVAVKPTGASTVIARWADSGCRPDSAATTMGKNRMEDRRACRMSDSISYALAGSADASPRFWPVRSLGQPNEAFPRHRALNRLDDGRLGR
jgi:hypothetical protein